MKANYVTLGLAMAMALVLGPSSSVLAADSFRCGQRIVETGMSVETVKQYCGEPTSEGGDRITYDRGPELLTVVLHVEPDNTVSYIEERPRQ